MSVKRGAAIVGSILWVAAGGTARAQIPDTFTNLQVLPKTVTKGELVETMRGFSFALAVRCSHCHVEKDGPPPGMDFAADDKPEKAKARVMMRMVAAVNADHLSRLDGRRIDVECATCHRGLTVPRTMKAVLTDLVAEKGASGAVQGYRELRERHLASGAYDFSDLPLDRVAESLIAQKRPAEAALLLELAAELHPRSNWTFALLGQAYVAQGEVEKARAAYERLLALDPSSEVTRRRLKELEAAKP
jgi:hypothetical protein